MREGRLSLGGATGCNTTVRCDETVMKIFTRTAVLSFGFAVVIGAAAEAQPLSTDRDMVAGVSVTEADCRALSGRLWVRADNRGFCVRYWFSMAGGSKDEALVAFHGDIGGKIDGKLQLFEQERAVSDGEPTKGCRLRIASLWRPLRLDRAAGRVWIVRPPLEDTPNVTGDPYCYGRSRCS